MRGVVVTAMLLCAALASAQTLNDSTFDGLKAQVLPTKAELGFSQIQWHPTFWDAVLEAQSKDKPILLWAMNGHPLACT